MLIYGSFSRGQVGRQPLFLVHESSCCRKIPRSSRIGKYIFLMISSQAAVSLSVKTGFLHDLCAPVRVLTHDIIHRFKRIAEVHCNPVCIPVVVHIVFVFIRAVTPSMTYFPLASDQFTRWRQNLEMAISTSRPYSAR